MIKAIIYDLDNLMVNSFPLHIETLELLLEKFGYKYKFRDLSKKSQSWFMGMRIFDILREIIKELKLNVDFRSFYREYNKIFLEIVKNKLEPMPGLLESIWLFKRNNFKFAIASSGTKEYINLVLKKFSISDVFDIIISGDDVKIGKPDPEAYFVSCNKLGIPPQESLVLEDATTGIESAKRAGCKCIAIKNSNIPSQDLTEVDLILGSLRRVTLDTINLLH